MEEVFDVSLEQWYASVTGPDYIKYIVTDRVIDHVAFLGYVGRSGLYTTKHAVDMDPYAKYSKFYQNVTRATEIGLVTHGETVAPNISEGWPVCTDDFFEWCGTGQFEGYWAPPSWLLRDRPEAWPCTRLLAPAEVEEIPLAVPGEPRPQAPRVEGPHRRVVTYNTFA
eukprot:1574199-Amphidinium_carterae.2